MTFRPTLGALALAFALHAHDAVAAVSSPSEKTPLNLGEPSGNQASSIGGSSGSGLIRTLIGLAVVVAVIWGVAWILRQVKQSKEGRASGAGLASLATLPLGPNRAVHVVRVGHEIMLIGSAEHHVTQLARYSEEEAERAGLLDMGSGGGAAVTAGKAGTKTIGDALDALRSWTVRK